MREAGFVQRWKDVAASLSSLQTLKAALSGSLGLRI